MRIVADVVVIGGGVVGCSAALHLAQVRGTRVIVVEKGSIGSGMTKRCGGLIRTFYPFQPEAQLAVASLRTFQNWEETVGGSCGFVKTGFAVVADAGQNANIVRGTVAMLRAMKANTQLLSPHGLAEMEPSLRADDLEAVAYEPDAGYADAAATTTSIASRARELGVTFQTGNFAKSILVERGRVFGVSTNTGDIETMNVVVAAGPWSDRLLKPLGLQIGIVSELTQVAYFERPSELKSGHLAYMDLTTGAYFRPHSYGLTQAGLFTSNPVESSNPDRFEEQVMPEFVADIQKRIAQRVPALEQAQYARGHTGINDMTLDAHAVIDRAPGVHGLVVAAGFSGTGFALAPAVGACIAELVTEGAVSTADLSSLSFARLQSQQSKI